MSSCGIVLISCRAARRGNGLPLSVTVPDVQRPERNVLSNVVLPAPEGPMTADMVPGSKLKLILSRILRFAPRRSATV